MAEIRTWKDAGAPQITNTDATSLHNWFKTILQDGYGVYSGLGWNVTQSGDTVLLDQAGTGTENIKIRIDVDPEEVANIRKGVSAAATTDVDNFTLVNPFMTANSDRQTVGPMDTANRLPGSFSQTYALHLRSSVGWPVDVTTDRSVYITPDGNKCFVLHQGGNYPIMYWNLDTPWTLSSYNISSAGYRNFANTGDSPYGFSFSNDGYHFLLIGPTYIWNYDLTIPWDISSASLPSTGSWNRYVHSRSTCYGCWYSDDGYTMFLFSDTNNAAWSYPLATPWRPSTAQVGDLQSIYPGTYTGNTGKSVQVTKDGYVSMIGDDGGNQLEYYYHQKNRYAGESYKGNTGTFTYYAGFHFPERSNTGKFYSTGNDDYFREYNTDIPQNATPPEIPWIIVGDDRKFYLIAGHNGSDAVLQDHELSNSSYFNVQFFGDYDSYVDVAGGNQAIICEQATNWTAPWKNATDEKYAVNMFFGNQGKIRLFRDYKHQDAGLSASFFDTNRVGVSSTDGLRYPYIDGNTYFLPLEIIGEDGVLYGKMPGAWKSLHHQSMGSFSGSGYEFINGTGPFAGKQLLYLRIDDPTYYGEVIIDTSF